MNQDQITTLLERGTENGSVDLSELNELVELEGLDELVELREIDGAVLRASLEQGGDLVLVHLSAIPVSARALTPKSSVTWHANERCKTCLVLSWATWPPRTSTHTSRSSSRGWPQARKRRSKRRWPFSPGVMSSSTRTSCAAPADARCSCWPQAAIRGEASTSRAGP